MSKALDDFINLGKELAKRCEKLSGQVNGKFFNPELFRKEISKLSIDELKSKIAGLETQLASMGDRRPKGLTIPQSGIKQAGQPDPNPNLFKID